MRFIQIICCAFIYLFSQATFATNNENCTPIPFATDGNDIILKLKQKNKSSKIVFFHNITNKSIFIDKSNKTQTSSAGWSSYLRPNNWSAIALNKRIFKIHCSTIEPGNLITLNCSKVIYTCTPKNYTAKSKLKGSFWLTEDKPWNIFVKALSNRRIFFMGQEEV
ncbi:hypothetical protein N9L02_02985 [Gammaproteobacteria bacterium]|nr:hypothetical protein [Gammaproteobacteria bacterium]